MLKRRDRGKRRRVSREQVRSNAEKGGFGGSRLLKDLPKGVREWRPEKAGRYELDFLPYEVSDKRHPDGVERGLLWYKRPFFTHRTDDGPVICPRSFGDKNAPCPWCKQWSRLKKKGASDDLIKPFNRQAWVLFNIVDPEDSDKVAVYATSAGKFWSPNGGGGLKEELEDSANEAHQLFFDTNKDGRTLHVRFSEKKFMGQKFLQATKFSFKKRAPLGDEIVDKCADLDKVLNVVEGKKLEAIFSGLDASSDKPKKKRRDEDDEEEDERRRGRKSKELRRKQGGTREDDEEPRRKKLKKRKRPDDEDDAPPRKKKLKKKRPRDEEE